MKIYTINDLKLKYKYSEKNIKKRHYKLLLNLLKSVNSGDYDINRYYSLIWNKVEPKNSEEKVIVRTINFIDDYGNLVKRYGQGTSGGAYASNEGGRVFQTSSLNHGVRNNAKYLITGQLIDKIAT